MPLRFSAIGRSMWPLVRPGDVARFEPTGGVPPHPGEIVLYHADGKLVAHRVIGRLGDGRLRLRGDFTLAEDAPRAPTEIVGRLVALERSGRAVDIEGPLARLLARALPPLQRSAPRALDGLRRGVRGTAQLLDRAWTAGPVRRLRGLAPLERAIAVATPADAADLAGHDRRRGRDPDEYAALPLAPSDGPCFCVIARVGAQRRLVGSTHLCEPPWTRAAGWDGLWIHDTFVEHRWRGRGLGKALTRALLTEAARRGRVERVRVAVRIDNPRSRQLHERLGFVLIGELGGHVLLERTLERTLAHDSELL